MRLSANRVVGADTGGGRGLGSKGEGGDAHAFHLPRKEAFSRYLPPERGLSSRRVQELADWYSDQAYWQYSKNALDAGALDAELRAILRKEVSPWHVEIEFERVRSTCAFFHRERV
jgi:hypothetical protein